MGLKKGPWTPDEDQKLLAYIHQHGFGNWTTLPQKAGLQRCGKSCRLRWMNYLRPDVKRGKFSLHEQHTIIQLHAFLGNRWSAIAAHLPNRTDNEIKNYWNTHIKKKFTKMGIDPTTHKPKSNRPGAASGCGGAATLSHTAQWERARLEAEARLAKESNKPNLVISTRTKAMLKPSSSSSSSANSMTTKSQCLDVLKAWQSVVSDMFDPNSKPSTTTATLNLGNNGNFYSMPHQSPANEQLGLAAVGSAWFDQVDQLIMLENRSINHQIHEGMNIERFDDDNLHYDRTAYNCCMNSVAAEDILEDFSDFFVHDFDYVDQKSNI